MDPARNDPRGPTRVGVFRGTRHEFAFFRPEGGGGDIYIAGENANGALHGDRVEAVLFHRHPRDFRMEAAVLRIIERSVRPYTGNIVRYDRQFYVVPDESLLADRIPIRAGIDVASGSKIIFHLETSQGPDTTPLAVVDEIIGDESEPNLDHLVVATQFQISTSFPSDVEDAAREAAQGGDGDREDLRSLLTVTIDPTDAKDFDDAISLKSTDGGPWELSVHIADVAEAVKEGSCLDLEARRRGTSTYFPGEVFPMLPEILSAGHLSLQPGMDRRAVTVHMTINAVGEVTSSRLTESLINSDARLDYGQVLRVLNKAETLGEPLDALLYKMFVLSRLVRKNRFSGGGYDLCIPEAELTLDGDGIPVELTRSVSDISHQIIEEFMILANREACAFVVSKGLPYLFRVHDQPDPASMEQFIDAVIVLKPSVRQRDLNNRPRLRRWLASLSPDDPLTRIIHYHFLRSLKKAEYAPIDLGHFGLGLHGYGHFTSPIRRYPDLWNHRLAKRALRREGPLPEASKELAAEVAAGSTEKEKNSEAAEREIIRIKILRWAERHLGEVWAGYVIECTPKGFHVELEEVPVEGFVPADGIPFPAKFQEGRFQRLKGRKGSDIQPGDRVEVQLVRVDLRRRWLDLALKTGSQPSPSKSRRTRRSKGGSRRPTPRKNARKDRRRRR